MFTTLKNRYNKSNTLNNSTKNDSKRTYVKNFNSIKNTLFMRSDESKHEKLDDSENIKRDNIDDDNHYNGELITNSQKKELLESYVDKLFYSDTIIKIYAQRILDFNLIMSNRDYKSLKKNYGSLSCDTYSRIADTMYYVLKSFFKTMCEFFGEDYYNNGYLHLLDLYVADVELEAFVKENMLKYIKDNKIIYDDKPGLIRLLKQDFTIVCDKMRKIYRKSDNIIVNMYKYKSVVCFSIYEEKLKIYRVFLYVINTFYDDKTYGPNIIRMVENIIKNHTSSVSKEHIDALYGLCDSENLNDNAKNSIYIVLNDIIENKTQAHTLNDKNRFSKSKKRNSKNMFSRQKKSKNKFFRKNLIF